MNTKLQRLQKYSQEIQSKLTDRIPEKHTSHPESYKRFLHNELKSTQVKIDEMKLQGSK